MHRTGHYGVNAIVYAPLAIILAAVTGSVHAATVGGIISIGLAPLPDIDIRLPVISHRGFTHTIWFAGITAGVTGSVISSIPVQTIPNPALFALGAIAGGVGVIGHLIGDALTPMGITPFAPLSHTTISLNVIVSNSRVANYGLGVIGIVAISASAYVSSILAGYVDTTMLSTVIDTLVVVTNG